MNQFEIIDFHTHPFEVSKNNICRHKKVLEMSRDTSRELLEALGISRICGSVICPQNEGYQSLFQKIKENNDQALQLQDHYKGFYVPGYHIHPDFPEESVKEVQRMHQKGVHLIGELVPYMDGWSDYGAPALQDILAEAARYETVVSFHTIPENFDGIETMVKNHPQIIFVAAHPGEYKQVLKHIELGKAYENYYLDLSGTGLFRYGMLRRAVNEMGAERIIFGSDYPTCNPAMFVGGVLMDHLLTDEEKEKILAQNAKRILHL